MQSTLISRPEGRATERPYTILGIAAGEGLVRRLLDTGRPQQFRTARKAHRDEEASEKPGERRLQLGERLPSCESCSQAQLPIYCTAATK
jgi:hypothetical protein